jgi:hypothetical protein
LVFVAELDGTLTYSSTMKLGPLDALPLAISVGFAIGFAGCGDGGSNGNCQPGERLCQCVNGQCLGDLVCVDGFCLSGNSETSGDGDDEGDTIASGDGDGDTNGDGDGDTNGDGDGDGDTNGDGDGDTNGDGDGDTNGDGDGDTGPSCTPDQYLVDDYQPPAVMLVVDASGSMVGNAWDHDNNINTPNVTRWNSLYSVVQSIMTNFGDKMLAGVQRFPAASACDPHPCYNETACTTQQVPEAAVAPNNIAAVLAAIPGANATNLDIEGGTPTTLGIQSAVNHLLAQPGDVPRAIVLITDGAANCTPNTFMPDLVENYDQTLPVVVADAYQTHGIPVFVVGIDIVNLVVGIGVDGAPEANPFERLNDVAVAGGTAKNGAEKFYNSTDQVELLTSLQGIFTSLVGCSIDLGELPDGLPPVEKIPFVELEFGGDPVPFVNSCQAGDGWTWVEEGVVVQLCGSACEQYAADGDPVTVVYGCE